MITNKLSRTCVTVLAALCVGQAFGQTILPPSAVGSIGTNDWNLSQSIAIPFGTPNSLPVLTANFGDTDQDVGLLQFDLTGISAPVASAQLMIYQALNQLGLGSTARFDLFQNLSAWEPTIGHWTDLPSVVPLAVATNLISDSEVGLFRTWDVTAVVNGWITGTAPNYGLRLERTDDLNPFLYFSAADGVWLDSPIFAPSLVLTTAAITAVPEPSAYGLLGAIALAGLAIRVRVRRTR
jgi:PEP-CTERM motif